MQPAVVVIRLQYQRRPEGEAGFEDTTSFPMRAAVRIREAFKPKFSEPFRLLRGLTNSTRASIHACQQSFCGFRVGLFHRQFLSLLLRCICNLEANRSRHHGNLTHERGEEANV